MSTSALNLSTADGQMDGYICRPTASTPLPAVIIYMDAMGVRPDLLSMAERLSQAGYLVVLPNLYYRHGVLPPVDKVAFAQPGPERERVFALIQSLNYAMVMADTTAIVDFLDRQPDVVSGSLGTVGYCMGGGYALTAAATFPDRVRAAASFHGGWLATDRPDSPHRLAAKMRAELYIGVAGIDPMFTDEERQRLHEALEQGGCRFTIEVYPDVKHGFSVTGHPVYDREASEQHWVRLLDLFDRNLKQNNA
jgi:carboxymethylenebutenolidase